LLLGWIFQSIFWNEGQIAYKSLGKDWLALTKWQRLEVAWSYGPSGLWHTLTSMDPRYLVLSLVLMGLILLVGIFRWQMILNVHGLGLPLSRTAEISLIAHFFNSFLLGSVGGDLLKSYYVARETHHKKTEAVVTVAVDRLIGLFSMLLLGCIMMIPNWTLLGSHKSFEAVVAFILAMTVGCAGFLFVCFWGGVSKGIPNARYWLRKLPKGQILETSISAFREFGKDRTFFARVLPVSMFANLICILHFMTLIWGFHLTAPLLAIAVVVPIVTCISTLPITPSGLGVRENLYVLFLAAPSIGIPYAQALLISLIGFGTSLFWSAVGGVLYVTVKDREHLVEIEQASRLEDGSDTLLP
jgi:uncharacterized protein (TIRG00374 family)